MIAHPRNLNQVDRGVEEAWGNFAGHGAHGGSEVLEITAAERIDKIGNMSALVSIEPSETTAKDIEAAAQAAADIAADIINEAQQLASDLRASAHQMRQRPREFP